MTEYLPFYLTKACGRLPKDSVVDVTPDIAAWLEDGGYGHPYSICTGRHVEEMRAAIERAREAGRKYGASEETAE